ncbi:SLBB domain-containing protein [Fontisphaera persica]|jgi:protein involved in polysaccharide export with SLBB domain|uniref:SLBB domain-containing protein n=1 Tax=Fontisphaera persica TaxID=2974023 RepID=UPI0024C05FBF|nr:SLBB domain-containing protein [Fontisphaera persica]WCJ58374.1 SLBB domain-containing protein [Fontisphaera persica]
MKATTLSIVGALAFAGWVGSLSVLGQDTEKIDKFRRELDERNRAEAVMRNLSGRQGEAQRTVERLQRKKADLTRDMNYYKSRLERATKDADMISKMTPVDKELLDSVKKDVEYYQGRYRVVEDELTKTEAELAAAVKALQESYQASLKEKILLPGQVVQLFVLEDETFNGLYQVREGGYLVLPRVGRVSVIGKDFEGAAAAIKAELEKTQLRNATVMLEISSGIYGEEESDVIYLAGEFRTTGPLRTPKGIQPTLVTTILRAGGLTPSADLTRVKLLRLEGGNALVEEVNVQAILDGNGLQSDLALAPGDVIVVPAFAPVIYVTGNVRSPGVLRLSPDEELTAYAAILRCGGFSRFAKLSGVYVLRDRGAGEKVKIPVNIKQLQAGQRADVILQGKDIVVVPEKFFSF